MSSGTSIEWTDATWNPIRARVMREAGPGRAGWHCEKVSPGCANCYAERFNGRGLPNGGTRLSYTKGSRAQVETFVDEDVLGEPLRWRKPRRVFVESMSDLFGEWVSDEQLDRVFAVMALARQDTFQVLTKRPERMREYLTKRSRSAQPWKDAARTVGHALEFEGFSLVPFPLPNVWLGVSVEDQQRADERIPMLFQTPAAKRFASVEPLLGPIRPGSIVWWRDREKHRASTTLDWVIIGGESGPGARPCDVGWVRPIVQECLAASVWVFVKQLGAYAILDPRYDRSLSGWSRKLAHSKGGDPSEWPEDLRVREFPREAVRS